MQYINGRLHVSYCRYVSTCANDVREIRTPPMTHYAYGGSNHKVLTQYNKSLDKNMVHMYATNNRKVVLTLLFCLAHFVVLHSSYAL